LVQASDKGFNLIGLSNNHTRDCYASPDTSLSGESASPDMTAKGIEGLGERPWLWAGISSTRDANDHSRARVRTFRIKGPDVRVVRKDSGGTGVVFESLGNFIHPSLGAQAKNFIGRALFDAENLKLRQVQVLPIANTGRDVRWSSVNGADLQANLHWTSSTRG